MENILTHYQVSEQTMALLPAVQLEYDTTVLERNKTLYIKKTPLQIMKRACLDHGSSLEGRRAAVMHQTGYSRKVPIPISLHQNLYAFPTLSPTKFHCHWIFYHHVKFIKPLHSKHHLGYQSNIFFKNGRSLQLKDSYYVLEKQMHRTAMCILAFSEDDGSGLMERGM
ncbi:competence protein ComK [Salirhabdus salicampi]|uniref:competence protein ComK n=1 Tax=Salirhabdus salicampi TaxID=476102 RepID=UPI0020C550AE|nr:competence protein ComK [Salirhabdus salicampi]MCP8617534.1 competence protein ComK [Salirhabdus salicampi]